MDWQVCMNQTLDYIDNNLSCDIDYSVAAKFMSCSEWEFRRVFSFLAQISLSEYIRRRRLTMAAIDIKNGEKIIDVAIRYGYDSQAAFSRAFNRFHGISPTLARNEGAVLKTFPRLTFKLILMEESGMKKSPNNRTNIIGAGEVGYAISVDMNKSSIHKTNSSKKDGIFIFSWSHPIHKCVAVENDSLSFKKNYFDESWYSVSLEGGAISLSDRMISTYINALTKSGFTIEEMIEESDDDIIRLYKDNDFAKKAKMLPVTFVIKARKL